MTVENLKKEYDKDLKPLHTISDYEKEIQRANEEYDRIVDKTMNKKTCSFCLNSYEEIDFLNFLTRRVRNCYIKINQLKNKIFTF